MSLSLQRRLLQVKIAVAGLIPVAGGRAGAILGTGMTNGGQTDPSLDSHVRYLSALLLGIGLAFGEQFRASNVAPPAFAC